MSATLARRDDVVGRFAGSRARPTGQAAAREQAAASFARLGLPGPRDEAWKYTSLRALGELSFGEPAPDAGAPGMLARVALPAMPRLVFIDGRLRPELCTAGPGQASAELSFGRLARPERDSFTALNTMLAEDGARIAIPAGVDAGTMQLISLASDPHGRPAAFYPRHRIELGAGARLTLIETAMGEGVYLHNAVSEILVGQGAALAHVRLQDESPHGFHIATLYAEIAERGSYDSFLLALGGRLSRTEMHVRIAGAGARVQLNCAQLLRGAQHGDFTTVLAHDAPGGQSRQTVRTVLDDTARGVFQGRIDVARVAQKTDGYQMNHALLLSPQAEIDSKPELRINADDVKCSHGATVGELDADQLFYLRSRGVPAEAARAMLIRGFLSESLAEVASDAARQMLDEAIDRWWDRHAA